MSNKQTDTKLADRKKRVRMLIVKLKKLFPNARIALNYKSPWELLVAVILSAQCTDRKVNEVTKTLFKKYPSLKSYTTANQKEFEQDIRETGFYKNKAKSVLGAARMVQNEFKGKIPRTMADILKLPGVARKTANVVLGNVYGVVEGIAVDTHVKRFAQKFELTDFTDPVRIERDLMRIVPRRDWFTFTYLAIDYGRNICPARKHDCKEHPLSKLYPKAAEIWPKR